MFRIAKRALARLRRYCLRSAKTYGKRHVMFNAHTAEQLLLYWKDMLPLPTALTIANNKPGEVAASVSDSNLDEKVNRAQDQSLQCDSLQPEDDNSATSDITFVIWNTNNSETVQPNDVVPFMKHDGGKMQRIPAAIRNVCLKEEAKAIIAAKLAGVEAYLNNVQL